MGKSSGNSAPSQQTVVQTTLPDYVRPNFERLLMRAEAATNQPYPLYGGPRIADFTTDQHAAFDMARAAAGATGATNQVAQGLAGYAAGSMMGPGYQAGQIQLPTGPTAFSPQMVSAPSVSQIGLASLPDIRDPLGAGAPMVSSLSVNPERIGDPGAFTSSVASQYMSPYVENVLDRQRARAQTRFDEDTVARQGAAARAGVFGGYRQAVEQAAALRDFNEQLDASEAAALAAAYESAQGQFERDRAARMGAQQFDAGQALQGQLYNQESSLRADTTNLGAWMDRLGMGLQRDTSAAGLSLDAARAQAGLDENVQELGATLAIQAALANQAANLDAQRLGDASRLAFGELDLRQFEANEGAARAEEQLSLARLREMLGAAGTVSDLGSSAQRDLLVGAEALEGVGRQEQQRDQASLDLAYSDFANQRDYDRNMVNFLSAILRGVPVSPTATTSQYQNPNPYSQLLGLGVSGAALNNLFRGGGG